MAPSASPRVFDLLAEARRALALKRRLVAAGKDVATLDAVIAGLYHDLGRAVVSAAEANDGLGFPVLRRLDSLDYEIEDGSISWYSDDSEGPEVPRDPSQPLFDPDDLDDRTDIPDTDLDATTPVMAMEREFTDSDSPEFLVCTLARAEAQAEEDPGSPLRELAEVRESEDLAAFPSSVRSIPLRASAEAVSSPPTWTPRVEELLALIGLPANFADLAELRVEASKVQWATSDLRARLGGLPAEVQIAFVGLLGARAQHLRGRLDSDVGAKLALDRLQRYRIDEDLPSVASLLPTPRPEGGTWDEDARRWWALLAARVPVGRSRWQEASGR